MIVIVIVVGYLFARSKMFKLSYLLLLALMVLNVSSIVSLGADAGDDDSFGERKTINSVPSSSGTYASGQLSARDRIRKTVEKAANEAQEKALDNEFRVADKDRDGALSRKEFGDYLIHHSGFSIQRFLLSSSSSSSSSSVGSNSIMSPGVANNDNIPDDIKDDFNTLHYHTVNFWSAFVNSVAMIIVTELGDKTFFIAAIMAMRHPRLFVYAGAMGALALMTVLSAAIGFALPQLLPPMFVLFYY